MADDIFGHGKLFAMMALNAEWRAMKASTFQNIDQEIESVRQNPNLSGEAKGATLLGLYKKKVALQPAQKTIVLGKRNTLG